jgi:ketosteroid isomerase-like protein
MKFLKLFLPVIFLLGIIVTGCGVKKHDPVQVKKDIDNNNALFAKSYNSKDVTGVMTFYSDDAELFPPNAPEFKGKENIGSFWKQGMNVFSDLSLKTDKIDVEGDAAIETGNYSLNVQMPKQPLTTDRGKYLVIWKYMPDGTWKINKDIFNSSLPLPSPENNKAGKR